MEEIRKSFDVVCIYHAKFMDEIMHAADMFEPTKALAIPHVFTLSYSNGTPKKKNILNAIRESLEKQSNKVTAVFIPNDPEDAWIDTRITIISDGKNFTLAKNIYEAYGLKLQCDLCGRDLPIYDDINNKSCKNYGTNPSYCICNEYTHIMEHTLKYCDGCLNADACYECLTEYGLDKLSKEIKLSRVT